MSEASIALNRFGLGARPGETGQDSKRALLAQLDRFDASPAPIAALPPTRTVAANLADYLQEQRQMRQQRQGQAPQRRPAGYRDPQMSDAMTAQEMKPGAAAPEAPDPVAQARRFAARQGRDVYANSVNARMKAA